LGWFLEIEIMTADNREQTVEESRERLLRIKNTQKRKKDFIVWVMMGIGY